MRKKSLKQKPSATDELLQAWLERNAPWLMHLDPQVIMSRVGLELNHGEMTGRPIEGSLAAARAELRRVYDGRDDDRSSGTGSSGNNGKEA